MSTTSSHQSSLEETRSETRKFMLLKDSQAKSKRGVNSTSKLQLLSRREQEQRVLKGSLWELKESFSPNHSLSSIGSSGSKGTGRAGITLPLSNNVRKVELDSIEYDEVKLHTSEKDICELSEQQCRLLLAIPDCEERYRVQEDKEYFKTLTLVNVNSRVLVTTRRLRAVKGIVRWKGRIANKQGISFGVEIQDPNMAGSGDSDGTFNSVRLFTCDTNNAVFVNVSSLRLIPPQRPERKVKRSGRANHLDPSLPNGNDSPATTDVSSVDESIDIELYPVENPRINDRVMWVADNNGYERATVKWIGILPEDGNTQDGELLIGVEFDNPVGKGTGFYQKKRLFHAKKGHASLVPLIGLYEESVDGELPAARSPPFPPPEFGDASSSSSTCAINAENVLRDLAIDIDSEADLTHGATHSSKQFTKHSELVGTAYPPSPKRLLNGGKSTIPKLTGNVPENASSSSDSLEHDRILVSAHCNSSTSSPLRNPAASSSPRKNKAKAPTGLIVPVNKHRPSSVGSISPRSDGWSQGSDTHSSPSHTTHSPLDHDATVVDSAPLPAKAAQPSKCNILNTSPARRKRNDQSPKKCVNSLQSAPSGVCRATPPSSQITEGSVVTVDGQPGVAKWIGYELSKPGRYFAGIQMHEPNGSCSSGWYGNERLVHSSNLDIMFVNIKKCVPIIPTGHANSDRCHSECYDAANIEGRELPPQSLPTQFIGQWAGIQGDLNSCYMDACLYAMFAFSTMFDSLLLLPPKANDISSYTDIQTQLRCRIVNPLRRNGIVMKDAIHRLRMLLDELGLVKGLREAEKDPEEFINLLLVDVFRTPPPIHLSNGQSCHCFHLLSERDARVAFPTVQELLEHSCAQEQLKFKQAPSYLILHMPRFGRDFRVYDKVLPSIELDVTDVIEGALRCCYVCGEKAIWECPECYTAENEWKKSTFCQNCSNTVHKHDKRSGHMPISLKLLDDTRAAAGGTGHGNSAARSPIVLKLFAVLCIDTSHYVAFTRTGFDETNNHWVLFDSMHERNDDTYVPRVVKIEDLTFWLSKEGFECIAKDFDTVPTEIKRLVQDAYICFYCQPKRSLK